MYLYLHYPALPVFRGPSANGRMQGNYRVAKCGTTLEPVTSCLCGASDTGVSYSDPLCRARHVVSGARLLYRRAHPLGNGHCVVCHPQGAEPDVSTWLCSRETRGVDYRLQACSDESHAHVYVLLPHVGCDLPCTGISAGE